MSHLSLDMAPPAIHHDGEPAKDRWLEVEFNRRMRFWTLVAAALLLAIVLPPQARADDPMQIKVGFIRQTAFARDDFDPRHSAKDDGLAGAQLAAEDNNTTGKFLNQVFTIDDIHLKEGDDPVAALNTLLGKGVNLIMLDLPPDQMLAVADAAKGRDVIFFNTSAPEDSLREENCRANVFHIAPTYSMLADGLAEYLIWKKWNKWFLIQGSHPEDKLFGRCHPPFGEEIRRQDRRGTHL